MQAFRKTEELKAIEQGVYAASLTPLNDDLTVNCLELFNHCSNLLTKGCKGIILFGTTGEGPSFSVFERTQVLHDMISLGLDPKKIILANGCSCLSDTIELTKAAIYSGCLAVLLAPPCFYKNIPEEGVISFYREIIQRTANSNLHVILYHIPQFSGVPISLNIIESLLREFPGTVIGMKESEGNLSYAKAVIDAFPKFQVFVANEKQIIEAVHYGASGSICGIANLYPELIVSLFEQGKKRELCSNPVQIDDIFNALQGVPFIAAFKAFITHQKGMCWQTIRPPFIPLTAEQKDIFLSKLSKIPI